MIDLPCTPSTDLSGKSALVTGGSSGIGLGAGVALARAGAQVTLAARGAGRLAKVVDQMQAEGLAASALVMDVADIVATAAQVAASGPFDILVNSAGMARHSAATETTEEDFDAVMNINLRGAYFLTQAVAKGMIMAGRGGSLINISSQMAHVGGVERALYCASKFAVEGFTKAMAIEFGAAGIRVNTICPTFILTPLTQPTFDDPDKRAWVERKIKLGRAGEIEDIMGAVLYLACDLSKLVTGSALMVDGGWTAD
ncbi:MAG: SDR family oxidoreductase [Alphaproteobacteria bacterium]|nr:SDR family oxidoreductase [Alphaproteobacteria bacterium]